MRTLLVLSVMMVSGCAAPVPSTELLGSSSPPQRTTSGGKDAGASAVQPTQPVVVEEGDATSTTPVASAAGNWQGHVTTTSAVDFGGGVFCSYRVVLSDIDVTLTLDAQGRVTSSRIQSTMTETTPSCSAAPLGVQENDYAFDTSPSTPATLLTASLAPDVTNLPLANVTLSAALVDPQNLRASVVFQRTGGTSASLDWKVTTQVSLTKH